MLLRFDPFREIDRAFEQFAEPITRMVAAVPFDAVRRDDKVMISFDVPGVSAEHIDLTVERDVLTLTVERHAQHHEGDEVIVNERRTGRFTRRVMLGENLDTDNIHAEHRDGVLTVTIPIAERAKSRKVAIASSGEAQAIEAASEESADS